jgi:hypothetical protein
MANSAPGTVAAESRRQRGKFNPTENAVQRTRAWTGLLVVVAGDTLIAAAAIFGVYRLGKDAAQTVAILSSAFTAIGTMTAAYFGIRAATNTAQSAVVQQAATQQAATAAAATTGRGDGGGVDGTTVSVDGGPVDGGGSLASGGAVAAAGDVATGDVTTGDAAGAVAAEPPNGAAAGGGDGADAGSESDRPVDEPETATQEEQYQLIRETGNARQDMTEEEEGRLLEEQFGPADEHGIYGAPKGDE